MRKRYVTILVATAAIFGFGQNVADAAANLITKVIVNTASEPTTMFVIGSCLVLVASFCRKNIRNKK
jgi:uncharacterized BrkB/YihY/UPF0761 family membrane protein